MPRATHPFVDRHERSIALALGILAVLRLLWLGASFPLFANTDEHAHFDAVVKHSEGYLPRAESARYGAESAALILLYRSPESFHAGEPPPPPWRAPAATF